MIRAKFGLPTHQHDTVKYADLVMLGTERRDLDIDDGTVWPVLDGIPPTDLFTVIPLRPGQAYGLFMARFNELTGEQPTRIIGYGSVFNSRSEPLWGFREIIKPGAFDDVLGDDIRGLFNHDPNFILGRSASGTLSVSVDDKGLRYDIAAPDTQTIRDLVLAPMMRGDITQSSFALTHGIATAYTEGGVLRIQRDITTYKKNAYGVADNSYLDSETLHTSAYVLRRLKTVITSKYGRHKLANDGTRFGPGQAIVTPAVIKGELLSTYRQMEREGIVENYDLFKAHLIVERDANDPSRINVLYPPDYVNQLRVFALLNQFRLQYAEESA